VPVFFRRSALAATALLIFTLAVPSAGGSMQTRPPGGGRKRPNVLIFLTDDQRATETMDVLPGVKKWFKKRGRLFPRSFVTTPLCCPSRASIFTGQYAHNHGIRTNASRGLDQKSTIQRYLQEAGYRTGIFGKYLNSWDIEDKPPRFRKWAIFDRSQAGYNGGTWNVQGHVRTVDTYGPTFIRRRAKGFLTNTEGRDRKPWFLFLAPPTPHVPTTVEPKYKDAAVGKRKSNPAVREKHRGDKPAYVRLKHHTAREGRRVARKQRRALLSFDDMVDGVMQKLVKLGEARNTLAFVLSDNGYLWSEHGMLGSVFSKNNPYTDSIKIPMLMRWPRRIGPHSRDGRFSMNVDLAPTIMDAANLSPDNSRPMDGHSLLDGSWRRRRMFLEYFQSPESPVPDWASIRTARYQYVEYYGPGGTIQFREYYNLNHDRWQLHNLFGDHDPTNDPNGAKLTARLTPYRSCKGDSCP
jgi:arylsulfatase A-like enzyme